MYGIHFMDLRCAPIRQDNDKRLSGPNGNVRDFPTCTCNY